MVPIFIFHDDSINKNKAINPYGDRVYGIIMIKTFSYSYPYF